MHARFREYALNGAPVASRLSVRAYLDDAPVEEHLARCVRHLSFSHRLPGWMPFGDGREGLGVALVEIVLLGCCPIG